MRKIYIHTIGCQMNHSDSERLAGFLEKEKFQIVASVSQAQYVIINTCGIRQSAEDRVYGLAATWQRSFPGRKIILTGCLAYRPDVTKRLSGRLDFVFPIAEMEKLAAFLRRRPDISRRTKSNNCSYLQVQPKYQSQIQAFVPIGNGCNNFCTYCVVPYARGRENWRSADAIIAEAKILISHGYREITLIAQNVNSYQSYIQTKSGRRPVDFPSLLRMLNDLDGDFWLRFATSHPKDMSDALIRTLSDCDKICEHIHLPLQAGDNKVLRAMNRRYTAGFYRRLIKKIRKIFTASTLKNQRPLALTTDIIVGFPGEIRQQFAHTLALIEEIGFDQVFAARYSPRPGTAAAQLADDVPGTEKKQREKRLERAVKKTALNNCRALLGRILPVLILGKNRHGEWFGLTRTNKKVIFSGATAKLLAGCFVEAKIVEAKAFGLRAEIINPHQK